MTTPPMLPMLERFLNVASSRHSLIVSNMANIDTPGYQTRDLDFRSELRRAFAGDSVSTAAVARTVPGLLARPDGNNVNLDREGLLMAETQLQYHIGIQLLRSEFQRLKTAITEGK